ncbi:MAG: hypothetical protein HP492_11080 [Nitrospira sp.]|nr:hypothetical protein [Nitrospira sp.]
MAATWSLGVVEPHGSGIGGEGMMLIHDAASRRTTVIDFKARTGAPVLLKVTNNATAEHGFQLTAAVNQSAPTVLDTKVVLKPGETKYIGVPTSDLFYAAGNVLIYRCHLHPGHVGGKLLMLK